MGSLRVWACRTAIGGRLRLSVIFPTRAGRFWRRTSHPATLARPWLLELPEPRRCGWMDALTLFGLTAVTLMLLCYALEERSPWFVLAFAGACALGSTYGFL